MRRLMILRHAKAERAAPGGRDHDRALNERGREDARKIGDYMARHGLLPDRVVVSPAIRTRETWEHAALSVPDTRAVALEPRLYEASPMPSSM